MVEAAALNLLNVRRRCISDHRPPGKAGTWHASSTLSKGAAKRRTYTRWSKKSAACGKMTRPRSRMLRLPGSRQPSLLLVALTRLLPNSSIKVSELIVDATGTEHYEKLTQGYNLRLDRSGDIKDPSSNDDGRSIIPSSTTHRWSLGLPLTSLSSAWKQGFYRQRR